MSGPGVVVAGGMLLLDHVALLPRLPEPGETIRIEDFHRDYSCTHPGGCSANIAAALSRTGLTPHLVAEAAGDGESLEYQGYLRSLGVRLDHLVASPGRRTPHCYSVYAPDGSKHALMDELAPCETAPVSVIGDLAGSCEAAVLVGGGMRDSMRVLHHEMAKRARRARAKTVLAVCGTPQTPDTELAGACDVIVCNELEASKLAEHAGCDMPSRLTDVLGATLYVTLGSDGSVVHQPGERPIEVKPVSAGPPVDPTGAGDAFAGGVVAAVVHGSAAVEAAELGTVLASFAIEDRGAQTRAPSRAEMLRRLEDNFGPAPSWLGPATGDWEAAE